MTRRGIFLVVVGGVVLFLLATAGTAAYTSRPGFCRSCHEMTERYDSWQTGAHKAVNCLGCHAESGGVGYVAAKLEGLSRVARYVIGRQNPVVEELTNLQCLKCHTEPPIVIADPVNMPHAAHIQLGLKCTTCHEKQAHDLLEARSADMATCFGCHTKPQVTDVTCETCHAQIPPGELPHPPVSLTGKSIYEGICSRCHGAEGEGGPNPAQPGETTAAINTAAYLSSRSDDDIIEAIAKGNPEKGMPAYDRQSGGPLSREEITEIVRFIRSWRGVGGPSPTPVPAPTETAEAAPTAAVPVPSFAGDILPIFQRKCTACHGTVAGLSLASYGDLMEGGASGPAVVGGDPDGSLVLQKQQTTHTDDPRRFSPEEQDVILRWILAGGPDN